MLITMVKETIGLSREYIIHPGESLAEAIEDRGMSQRELAVRTGMTEKHISTVINGQKNISPAFARRLEYALGIKASFWMNLQMNYDQELLEYEDLNSVSDEEMSVLNNLKEVSERWVEFGFLKSCESPVELILDYRKIMGISNLLDIPKLSNYAAIRAQCKDSDVDPYVLCAWQRMCELLADTDVSADGVDVEKLISMIPDIKNTMFLRSDRIEKHLSDLFADCGIAFKVVPDFKGAPVQGFIKKADNGTAILCVALRQKYADIFWYTLFREIAHIIKGDTKRTFVDFIAVLDDNETKTDRAALDFLIDPHDYTAFVDSKRYERLIEIEHFARSQSVKDYIVLGRLMKEKRIPWGERPKYEWG